MLYLDHAATTPLRPEVAAAMEPFSGDLFGNPSGLHGVSRRAKNALEAAREEAAGLIGADHPLEVVFTGGGTESDNLGVLGPALASGGGVVTTVIEHEAVLESARFAQRLGRHVAFVGVDSLGVVDPDEVAASVDDSTAVVSVMAANNETGAIQPVAAVADAVDGRALIHTDAVQAFVSEDIDRHATKADLITLASHKLGGPKGVGLLWVRDGVDVEPVLHGGGQERGRRSGTHNVAGIVGMVAAMREVVKDRARFRVDVAEARDRFEATLRQTVPDLEINGPIDARLVQHSHVRIPGVDSETLLVRLDGAGVAAAAGSACQSGAVEPSHVLTAMGFDTERAAECVRFTFGWTTTVDEAERAAAIVVREVEALR